MKRVRPPPFISGKWHDIDRPTMWIACCDCGLVHSYKYRTKRGKLQRCIRREAYETKLHRAWLKRQAQ